MKDAVSRTLAAGVSYNLTCEIIQQPISVHAIFFTGTLYCHEVCITNSVRVTLQYQTDNLSLMYKMLFNDM